MSNNISDKIELPSNKIELPSDKRGLPRNQISAVNTLCFLEMHCVKSVQIRSYFWSVFSCIRTRHNFVFGQFSRSVLKEIRDCNSTTLNDFR